MENITQSLHLSGLPDTYLKGDSYKSEIRIFRPFASFSMVSIFGMEPLQISDIVDFGTPVRIDTWRTVNFLFDMIFCNRISIIKNYIPVSTIKILANIGRSDNMGLRFRKSFKVAPGVKVNIGKKNSSISFGGKGARYTVSSSGRRTKSVSIPGTGISYVDTKTSGSGNKKSQSSKNSASARHISTGSGASPSPKRDKKPEMQSKEKHASVVRMIAFYLFVIFFAFIALFGLLLIIGSISEGPLEILASLCWLASGICGVVSAWKMAKRERYLLKHGETYRNETPKLIIGAFVFVLAALISASFIPDPPDQEQISVKEETEEAKEEAEEELDKENKEAKEEIPDEIEEEQEQIVDNQSDQEESEVPVAEEPVQEEVVQEDPAPQQEITVYITNTGSKYHRDTCRTLKNSKIPISLSEAVRSYEPCGICNPPTN